MQNEIEKMYSNAGIKCLHPSGFCKHIGLICEVCERHKYPPFTAEKQIKLLIFILKRERILAVGYTIEQEEYNCMHYEHSFESFEEALCADINYHWKYFTEEERKQIKEILE